MENVQQEELRYKQATGVIELEKQQCYKYIYMTAAMSEVRTSSFQGCM